MATFEKVTPVTEDEADDIRVTLELDEGEVECEILTIFEANNRDYIALMVSEITLCIVIIRERNLYTFNEIHSPFFWIREGRAFRCPLLFGKRPKKSSKKRLELLVIPLICVHADFFPPSPSSEWLSSFPACP